MLAYAKTMVSVLSIVVQRLDRYVYTYSAGGKRTEHTCAILSCVWPILAIESKLVAQFGQIKVGATSLLF